MRRWRRLLLLLVARAVASAVTRFGLFDFESSPGAGWQLMSSADFTEHKAEFIAAYNAGEGIKVIAKFQSGNCCIAVKGGNKLTISGSPYGYQFPASKSGGIRCNPTGGYTEAVYQFYRLPKLNAHSHSFADKPACATSHNPGVYMQRTSSVVPHSTEHSSRVEFGMFDSASSPPGGWSLMSAEDFQTHRNAFVARYNEKGLPILRAFKSGNCCFAVKSGDKLIVSGTKYGFVFPSELSGALACSPASGYSQASYKFYNALQLDANTVFTANSACVTNHNPGVYMRLATAPAIPDHQDESLRIAFGLYDREASPGNGWVLADVSSLNTYKSEFIKHYNENGGLSVIKPFQSGNCCVAVKSGQKLIISGTPYGYQFPASASGGIRCNPTDGYAEAKYVFFRSPKLSLSQTFSEKPACANSHNPAVFIKLVKTETTAVEFGLYDRELLPAGGWTLMAATDFGRLKREFIAAYNANGGLSPIALFQSGNCCIATKSGKMLTVSGTPYGYQFPASQVTGDIRCNPSDGYKSASIYSFYKLPMIEFRQSFGEQEACAVSHNPAVWMRAPSAVTAMPTPKPTPKPTPASVHCQMGQWGSFSLCSTTCGEGNRVRSRVILRESAHGGDACPALRDTEACRVQDCPVHCDVAAWGTWGACDSECGGGFERREREITQHPTHSGDQCPELVQLRSCNNAPCPVHCSTTDWSDWSECNAHCGGGATTRMRVVVVHADFNGRPCPHLQETRPCNTFQCPVHCTTSPWGAYGACNAACGGGTMSRSRHVLVTPAFGGDTCPTLESEQPCNTTPCPVHCKVSAWSAWGHCSRTCGSGSKDRARIVIIDPDFNGNACPVLVESRTCNPQYCPIDCEVGVFGPWSQCTVSCNGGDGGGTMTQSRSAINGGALYGGEPCPALMRTTSCNTHHCPVDCRQGKWGAWSPCSATCGGGRRTRSRSIDVPAAHGGKECSEPTESETCGQGRCPIHCEHTQFTSWGGCSHTCGGGHQARSRTVARVAAHGGKACEHLDEVRPCAVQSCPVDCVTTNFTQWSKCTRSCGGGVRERSRSIVLASSSGGKACGALWQSQGCNEQHCPISCVASGWSTWGGCSSSCGAGIQRRTRSVELNASFGGQACPSDMEQRQLCNDTIACPIDCKMGVWGMWGACTASCKGGAQIRSRVILVKPADGGTMCGDIEQTRACATGPCPVHCTASPWGSWTACTRSCGGGTQTRARSIVQHARHGGYVCPTLQQTVGCNAEVCAVDCAVSDWSAWSSCSATCGSGNMVRSRSVTGPVAHGGSACPPLTDERACNQHLLPCFCYLDWGQFGDCSATCGGGLRTRSRSIATSLLHLLAQCPRNGREAQACNTEPCPIDCTQSSWGGWTDCSRTCAVGTRTRVRSVLTAARFGGHVCGRNTESELCGIQPCAVDCAVGNWTSWTGCTRSCGSGMQSRKRVIVITAEYGGRACPHVNETLECNAQHCPVDCALSSFSDWASCSRSCAREQWQLQAAALTDVGSQQRHRTVTANASYGGKACGVVSESRACNAHPCPVNCAVTLWGNWTKCSSSCGPSAKRTRTRSVLTAAAHGGWSCPDTLQTESCGQIACPTDCLVSAWSDWQACSATCEYGIERRFRTVLQNASFGGVACGALIDTKSCHRGACPVHCAVSEWGSWSDCTKTCQGGTHWRARAVVTHAASGGYTCPSLQETLPCHDQPCPEDCELGVWGAWTGCDKTCGGGTNRRSRIVVRTAQQGGACPDRHDVLPCAQQPCPVNCKLSAWSSWTKCSKKCNGGTQLRSRSVAAAASHGGSSCPHLSETQDCATRKCTMYDRQQCSHTTCDYRAHSIEREQAIMNFPETHWRDWAGRGLGRFFHVGVHHSWNEENGMKHFCANINPQEQEEFIHSCKCICWEAGGGEQHTQMEFAVYDSQPATNITGWQLMSVQDFQIHKEALVQFYNHHRGLPVLAQFTSGSCCFSVSGGKKLRISNSPNGYLFPADDSGSVTCNPAGGYKGLVQFWRLPQLTQTALYTSVDACGITNHNPALYMRKFRLHV